MTRIKVCGLRRELDIAFVNEAKPDFAGFIIEVPKSHRSVTEEQVRALTRGLSPEVIPVGVFVNAPIELPIRLLQDDVIKMAQLHGTETEDDIKKLQKETGKQIIKAFSIHSKEDIEKACASPADYILLDHGKGGTGKTFDWSLMFDIKRDYFLAGGLGPDNCKEAIDRFHPWAVDLSSSLETNGCKDLDKIKAAVKCVQEGKEYS